MQKYLTTLVVLSFVGGPASADSLCSGDETKAIVGIIANREIAKPMLKQIDDATKMGKLRISELQAEISAAQAHRLPEATVVGRPMTDCSAVGFKETCFDYAGRIAGDQKEVDRLQGVLNNIPSSFSFHLNGVITTDETSRKTSCKAELIEDSNQGYDGFYDITFTVEMTDDQKPYVTVYGLHSPIDKTPVE